MKVVSNNFFQTTKMLYNKKGEFVGINLGYEYSFFHENDIRQIKMRLEMDENLSGINGKKIRNISDRFVCKEIEKEGVKYKVIGLIDYKIGSLTYHKGRTELNFDDIERYELDKINNESEYKENLRTTWDSNGFLIMSTMKFEKEINQLHEAFLKKDIVIEFNLRDKIKDAFETCEDNKVLNKKGLIIGILSKITEDEIKEINNEGIREN